MGGSLRPPLADSLPQPGLHPQERSGWPVEGGAQTRPRIGRCSRPGPIGGRRGEPRPVSRTPRCSSVSSQLVVKATEALKISFKEPPSGGTHSVVMTTGPQGLEEPSHRSHPAASFKGVGGLGGRSHLQVSPAGGVVASYPISLQVWASASFWGAHPLPSQIPQNEPTNPSKHFFFFFCPFAKGVKNSEK